MCRMHLDKAVHTAGDFSDPIQDEIRNKLQTSYMNGKGIGSSRVDKTSTKTIFITKSATKQGTLSQL